MVCRDLAATHVPLVCDWQFCYTKQYVTYLCGGLQHNLLSVTLISVIPVRKKILQISCSKEIDHRYGKICIMKQLSRSSANRLSTWLIQCDGENIVDSVHWSSRPPPRPGTLGIQLLSESNLGGGS